MPRQPRLLSTYWRLVPFIQRQWPLLIAIVGLTAVSSAASALQPWPVKLLVDHALGDQPAPEALAGLFGWLAGWSVVPLPLALVILAAACSLLLFALDGLLELALVLAWTLAGQRMVYDLACVLFRRLLELSPRFHGQRTVGDSLLRITGDSWCVYRITDGLLVAPALSLFQLAAIGGLAWTLDPRLTLLSFSVAPAMVATSLFFGRWLTIQARRDIEARSQLVSLTHQTIGAVPLVQGFGAEAHTDRRFRALAFQAVRVAQRDSVLTSSQNLVNGLILTVGTATILFVGGGQVLTGALSLGSLLVFLAYLRSIQLALQKLIATYTELKKAEASIERVLEVLDSEEIVREQPNARALPRPVRGHLRLVGVSFGYQPERPVLHDVSLEVFPGQTVALVGPSGAGKSTLAALIPRFFDPGRGHLELDGHDLRTLRLADLRAQVALVLQEPFLLPRSVADNIAYARPFASRAAIEAAARAANAHAFIQRLPHGYDTLLDERGASLSGGEKQRLAIARALLKDAPILILDEPTAALDAETEALLLAALDRLLAGRTAVIIAHRFSTIRRADHVVVLDHGQVVEQGSPATLLATDGPFRRLHDLHAVVRQRESVV